MAPVLWQGTPFAGMLRVSALALLGSSLEVTRDEALSTSAGEDCAGAAEAVPGQELHQPEPNLLLSDIVTTQS